MATSTLGLGNEVPSTLPLTNHLKDLEHQERMEQRDPVMGEVLKWHCGVTRMYFSPRFTENVSVRIEARSLAITEIDHLNRPVTRARTAACAPEAFAHPEASFAYQMLAPWRTQMEDRNSAGFCLYYLWSQFPKSQQCIHSTCLHQLGKWLRKSEVSSQQFLVWEEAAVNRGIYFVSGQVSLSHLHLENWS